MPAIMLLTISPKEIGYEQRTSYRAIRKGKLQTFIK
jgi:hypothetical protein